MDYFDSAYFDPTYFDTQPTAGGHPGRAKPKRRRAQIIQPPAAPVDDEDWLLLI